MLTVDVTKCEPDAPAKEDPQHRLAVGLTLLVLGVPEITAKTLPEVQARQLIWSKLQGRTAQECDEDIQYMRDHLGVKVNANKLTRTQFLSNISRDFFRKFEL